MDLEHDGLSRRGFIRYTTIGGLAIPLSIGGYLPKKVFGSTFNILKDRGNPTEIERQHPLELTMSPVVEDGAQAPFVVEIEHPMEPDHYIKSIQILNYADPVVIKGKFYFTPANGVAYLATQIRLAGGNSTVWAIAECTRHGKWAVSKDVKVAAGGC